MTRPEVLFGALLLVVASNSAYSFTQLECEETGAVWFTQDKPPKSSGYCLWPTINRFECNKLGGIWSGDEQLPPTVRYCLFTEKRSECSAKGGNWEPTGEIDMGCRRKSADGGKPCKDSSECQFGCRPSAASGSKKSEVGQCSIDDNPLGCRQYVKDGTISTICIRS